MSVTHVGSTKFTGGSETTGGTITISASGAAGDDAYVWVESRDHNDGVAYPSVTDNDTGGNTWDVLGTSYFRKLTLYHKKLTSGSASKTITISGARGSCSAGCTVYRGAFPSGDPTTNLTWENHSGGVETHAGFTPAYADSMICLAVGNHASNNLVTSPACTTPGALTNRFECLSIGGNRCGVNHSSAPQVGGPTATGAFTWAQNNNVTVSVAFAIRPAAGGATVTPGVGAAVYTGFASTVITSVVSPKFHSAGPFVEGIAPVVPLPAHQKGRVFLLLVRSENNPISLSDPQGFVEIDPSAQGTGPAGGPAAVRGAVYVCRATSGSMGSPQVAAAAGRVEAQVLSYTDCQDVGNPWDGAVLFGNVAVSGTAVTIPGDSTSVPGCRIVAIVFHALSGSNRVTGWTNAGLVSIDERTDVGTTQGGSPGGFSVADGVKAAAGAFGATTATLDSPGSVQAFYYIALAPVTGGGGSSDVAARRYTRLLLTNTPGVGPPVNQIELVERRGVAGALGSTPLAPSQAHPATTHIRPIIAANWNNTADLTGEFDVNRITLTQPSGSTIDIPTDDVTRKVGTITIDDGVFVPSVGQNDGAGSLPLVKGVLRGTGRHFDNIIFANYGRVFQSVPKVVFSGGITHQPLAKWGNAGAVDGGTASGPLAATPEYEDFSARDLSQKGFTIGARLRQKGTITSRSLGFAGTALSTIEAEDVIATITNGAATDDVYIVNVNARGEIRGKTGSIFRLFLNYEVETTINSGSLWSTRATGQFVFASDGTTNDLILTASRRHTFNAPNLVGNGLCRCRIRLTGISTSGPGFYIASQTWVKGETSTAYPTGGLNFNTSSDTYCSKTPDADDVVYWEATGYV